MWLSSDILHFEFSEGLFSLVAPVSPKTNRKKLKRDVMDFIDTQRTAMADLAPQYTALGEQFQRK